MIYIVIFLVLVGLAGFANALDENTSNTTPKPLEEYYEIEIIGLNDKYVVDEKYSFYFIISGYGYSCAGYEISYPDKNGKIMHMSADPLCDPNQSKEKFEINSLHHPVSLANVGITNPGTYTVTVTFDKPSKYFPTTVSKEFQVVEKLNEEINESSPLKQLRAGIAIKKIQCRENFILIQKYDGSPACVKPESINILIHRGWADEKFRTPPIIDLQSPDRIFREVGYLGLMMLLPHIEENQTIAISLEGKPNLVVQMIQRYGVEVLSEKTNTDESFSNVFGKITKPNLQKFFEEDPMTNFAKRGILLTSLGGYQDNTGTYGPFNQFLTDKESQIIGKALQYYENKRTNGEEVHFNDFVEWPTGKINESFFHKLELLENEN